MSGHEEKEEKRGQLPFRAEILFLDEPTTGLDASTAKKIVKILRALSLKGMAIACTIHQPRGSIFMSFDKVSPAVVFLCGVGALHCGIRLSLITPPFSSSFSPP